MMRKQILIILIVFMGIFCQAQNSVINKSFDVSEITDVDSVMMKLPNASQWSVTVHWVDVVGSDGEISLFKSNTDSTYAEIISSDLPYTITGTTGTHIFESEKFTTQYIWVKLTKESMTEGKVYIIFNANKLK